MTQTELSFEEALSKLEEIVRRMDDPTITIGESLSLYEEGLRLSAQCSQTLEAASLKIEEINRSEALTASPVRSDAVPPTSQDGPDSGSRSE